MVLAGLAGLGIFIAKEPYGYDLWAYVLAARHLLAGEPLYAAQPEIPFGPFGEYHYAPPAAVAFVLLLPTILEIALGNLNLLTLALCLAAWELRGRSAAAGTVLAIAIGLKLLPLTLVLFYLASGRWRVVAWTIAVGMAGLVVTAAVFASDFPAYVALLLALRDSHWAADLIASTPPAEVAAVLGSPIGRWLLPVASLAT